MVKSSEKLCWVYMTTGTFEEAKKIADKLIVSITSDKFVSEFFDNVIVNEFEILS